MRIKLTNHFIRRWNERLGERKVSYMKYRLRGVIRSGPLYYQGDGRFIVPLGKKKYAVVCMAPAACWVGITIVTRGAAKA